MLKETLVTICRLPKSQDHLCSNPNGDGHCGECDLALEWIMGVSEQFSNQVLRLRRTTSRAILQADENRPKAASIVKGVVYINPSFPKES
jgi:hypothetical protein